MPRLIVRPRRSFRETIGKPLFLHCPRGTVYGLTPNYRCETQNLSVNHGTQQRAGIARLGESQTDDLKVLGSISGRYAFRFLAPLSGCLEVAEGFARFP